MFRLSKVIRNNLKKGKKISEVQYPAEADVPKIKTIEVIEAVSKNSFWYI